MYYLLETNYFVKPTAYRTSSLVDDFDYEPSAWVTGHKIEKPEEPIAVEFWEHGGGGLAEILLDSFPLFSKEMVEALQEFGVNNLQVFPVKITEREGKNIDQEYFAVNIVGLVKSAKKSAFNRNFRKWVIDESLTKGFYIFRLAESVTSIIVHEKVKSHLERKGFKYLSFRSLAEK